MVKTKRKKKNTLLITVSVFFLAFLGFFVYNLVEYLSWANDGRISQVNTETVYNIFNDYMLELSQIFNEDTITPAGYIDIPIQTTFSFNGPSPLDIVRSHTQNNDIVAYIFIDGTNINNVVMHTYDNDFYLYHDMYGNPNVNGALFMDFRNNINFLDPNTIIYGHNMRNGTMFHNLRYYMQQSFFDNNRIVKVITDTQVFIYEIFSTFSTLVDFDYIQVFFENEQQFGGLIDELKARSIFTVDTTVSTSDNILILSTCTNVDVDARYVVVAKLVSVLDIV